MPRRQPPTIIPASHADTAAKERVQDIQRQRNEAAQQEVLRASQPSAWEADPEPEPTPQPKQGRPKTIVIERAVKPPRGGAVLNASQVEEMRFALMQREAHSTGTERAAAARARRTLGSSAKETT